MWYVPSAESFLAGIGTKADFKVEGHANANHHWCRYRRLDCRHCRPYRQAVSYRVSTVWELS